MITGVAFCPQSPALVPGVGRGLDADLGPVRAACRTAIRRVAAPGTRIVVVGSGANNASFGATSRGTFAGFGVDLVVVLGSDDDGPVDLPAPLAVGAWLVRDALGPGSGATAYTVDGTGTGLPGLDAAEPVSLIVVGDGSACRTEKAPGYLRPGAVEFDQRIATALASGSGGRLLRAVVPRPGTDAADLMIAGEPAWAALAPVLGSQPWDAELLYDGAPFGVGYFVAAWTAHRG